MSWGMTLVLPFVLTAAILGVWFIIAQFGLHVVVFILFILLIALALVWLFLSKPPDEDDKFAKWFEGGVKFVFVAGTVVFLLTWTIGLFDGMPYECKLMLQGVESHNCLRPGPP